MIKSKIFTFGCSYATGEELLIHELADLNEYRLSTADDPRKFFKQLEDKQLNNQYTEIKEKQKLIAWPQLLADKLGYTSVNLAESGNSLDKMLFQLYEQIENNAITKDDIILISLTKSSRNAFFNETVKSFQLPSLYWPVNTLMTVDDVSDMKPVINKKTDQALLEWFTDDRIAWDFIKNIQAFENLKTSFNLYILPVMNTNISTTLPVLTKMYNTSMSKFLTDKGLDDFSFKRLPWGHPEEDAHVKYAGHLYEILRKL